MPTIGVVFVWKSAGRNAIASYIVAELQVVAMRQINFDEEMPAVEKPESSC